LVDSLKKMSKIAFVTVNKDGPWGGSEELWVKTALNLAERGHQVSASVRGWPHTPAPIQQLAQAIAVSYRWYDKTLLHKLAYKIYRNRLFDGWLDQIRPDLVVISQAINFDGLEWMESCLHRGIPYATICQAAAESHWMADDIATRLKPVYQAAVQNYFVSQRNIDLTVKQMGSHLGNTAVVRNPFQVAYDAALPWPSGDVIKLACVGRLHPMSKGQDILFEVLRADKWQQRPLKVTLFGSGPNEQSLRALKDLWQLDNVEFGQFTHDVEGIWRHHQALILPSRYEGLPLVVVEAMLCGRPCIVTDVAGNAELIEDNIHGFIAKAPTAELFDEALERAWQSRESWYDMGKVAASQARKLIPRDPIATFADNLESLMQVV
jgi:glycosyltransferase involved in cell wall biosynthesis